MSFLDRLLGRDREPAPDAAEAPRGGIQSEEYRTADPREIVESEGTLMSGPGGAPQDSGPADHPDAAGLEDPEEQEQPGQ